MLGVPISDAMGVYSGIPTMHSSTNWDYKYLEVRIYVLIELQNPSYAVFVKQSRASKRILDMHSRALRT